jgi:TRAP-type C4-dicarboxylate transport system permease small subunit
MFKKALPTNDKNRRGGKMTTVERVARAVLLCVRLLGGALLFASAILIVINAIGRYVFAAPILWGEEVLRFGLLWIVFLGAVLVSWDDRHLRMDLLSSALKGRALLLVRAVTVAVFLGLTLYIAYYSLIPVSLYARTGQVSQIAEIPMAIPHAIIPVSMALMFLAVAIRIRGYLRGNLGHDDTGGDEPPAGETAANQQDGGPNRADDR